MKLWMRLLLLVLCFALVSLIVSCGIGTDKGIETESETDIPYIELTMDNYAYYLSIDEQILESGSAAGGMIRYSHIKVTVSGAVMGLFQDCSLFYRVGEDEEKEVKLNAAGFATFQYTKGNQKGEFSFTRVTGRIII